MSGAWSDLQFRWCCAVVLMAAGALMAGCASDPVAPSTPSAPAAPATPSTLSSWFPSIGGNFLSNTPPAGPPTPGGPPPLSPDEDCPTLQIRNGAATLAIAAKTEQATAQDLRYQLTFTNTARQCMIIGTAMRMRVGVQGRVIAGPAGAPPQVEVPLRYAVVREGVDPKTITTKFKRFPVNFPQGAGNVLFTEIEEDLSFPIPSQKDIDAYVVYIGFDDQGDRSERRPPAAKKNAPRGK
jgi:hypothetical protein